MGLLELGLLAAGASAALIGLRAYLKGPRCKWSGNCRVAVLGDSITEFGGYGRYLASRLPRYTFDNHGISGQGTAQIYSRLVNDIIPSGYDEVIILAGGNDLGRPDAVSYVVGNLERMVKAAKRANMRVVLLSLTPWDRVSNTVRQINSKLKVLAPLWGVDDFVNVWPALADANGGLRRGLYNDNMHVHPTAEGHRIMGEAIERDAY